MIDLFIVAGEASGDLQGAKLIEALLNRRPQLQIGAVAGPRMRAHPIQAFFPMENLQVMGFIDVFLALPRILRQFLAVRKKILALNPKAVLCIDYPGFNLRLERSLRKKGYKGKLIHFVCPSVWAWGKGRIPIMAKHLDLLLTLFPFEEQCFLPTSLPVQYVGHPLTSAVRTFVPSKTFRQIHGIGEKEKILGLFPGSRKSEIERNLPFQLRCAQKLTEKDPQLRLVISVAHTDLGPLIRSMTQAKLTNPEENYDLMQNAHLAIATSGTVAFELALHGTPTLINFSVRPIDLFLARKIFRLNLPFYSLPNIITSQSVFPELLGPNLTDANLLFWAEKFWSDTASRKACVEGCDKMRKSLGIKDAPSEAATAIFSVVDF
jgi:lipid-A-disaccharide synthase